MVPDTFGILGFDLIFDMSDDWSLGVYILQRISMILWVRAALTFIEEETIYFKIFSVYLLKYRPTAGGCSEKTDIEKILTETYRQQNTLFLLVKLPQCCWSIDLPGSNIYPPHLECNFIRPNHNAVKPRSFARNYPDSRS